jgi:hypothetical protein
MRIISSIVLCGLLCGSVGRVAVAEPVVASGVSVMTASDSSPERLDARARKLHGQIARRAATETLRRGGIDARRAGLAAHQLDVSVTHWRIASAGGRTDVTAEIRIVLCDDKGKMLSIVHGKARVSGEDAQLAGMREQVIVEGVGQLVAKFAPQIARTSV